MRALALSLLAVLACGAEPAPAAPTPAPAKAPAKAEPVQREAMPLELRGRVFLVSSEVGLLPLACHDVEHADRFRRGEACLGLLPVGSEVRGEDGVAHAVTGTAVEPCGEVKAVTVTGAPETWRGHATTPPAHGAWVEAVPLTTPGEADKAAPAELRRRLVAALSADQPALAKLAARQLEVRQRAVLDLDGDGEPEQLAAVAVPGGKTPDGEPLLAYAGLYLLPAGEAPPRQLVGAAPGGPQYTVLGALDLDADGKRELWLNTYEDEGFTQSVQRVGDAGLTELGAWRCAL
jgi:hypothetical protein